MPRSTIRTLSRKAAGPLSLALWLAVPDAGLAQAAPPAPGAPPGAVRVERNTAPRCQRPRYARDLDIRNRAKDAAFWAPLCVTSRSVRDGNLFWRFTIVSHRRAGTGPVWVVPHDDEDAAFAAGLDAVRRYGGALVAVETGEARFNRDRDPNNNFGMTAEQVATCAGMGGVPQPNYTDTVLNHFPQGRVVLALHTNHNGHKATGGSGDISAAVNTPDRHGILASHPGGAISDPDNIVLIPGLAPLLDNDAVLDDARFFGARGINVVYERITRSDCSLSHHATLERGMPYYNIEVEHGAADIQREIIDALMQRLGIAPLG